jgi:pimeloyl-ACP methyl ester carboxylesterase
MKALNCFRVDDSSNIVTITEKPSYLFHMGFILDCATKVANSKRMVLTFLTLLLIVAGCKESGSSDDNSHIYPLVKSVEWNGTRVDIVVEEPRADTVDVMMAYHGTVTFDNRILEAAHNMLDRVRAITHRRDVMIISVAYPEEGLPIGDNVRHSAAALMWVKHHGAREFGVVVRRIFLIGHSQGGYVVTRLNTMHQTDGIIANAPGPFNLVLRCSLEENGQIPGGIACGILRSRYGSVLDNPEPYMARSLLSFIENQQSPMLFVQGLNDSNIQMTSWPIFRNDIEACTNCAVSNFVELPGMGHAALFESPAAIGIYNEFIR